MLRDDLSAELLGQLRAAYPRRSGGQVWPAVERQIAKHIAEGHDPATMLKGAQNYRIHCGRKQIEGTEFVMMAKTFFGRDMHWVEWAEMDLRTPHQIAQDTEWEALEARAHALGFRTVDRSRGLTVARYAIEQAERQPLRVVK